MLRMLLRTVVVIGLGYQAYAHWHLASNFDGVTGNGKPISISEGDLFRVEAVAALVALVLLAVLPRRWTVLVALVVAAGGAAAVLLYRYVDVGAIGPFPNMYEPFWYPEKVWSVIAEGCAAVAAATLLVAGLRPRAGSS
jgi:hypothetical protein